MDFIFGEVVYFLIFVGSGIAVIYYSRTIYDADYHRKYTEESIEHIGKIYGKEFSDVIGHYSSDNALTYVMNTDAWHELDDNELRDGLIENCLDLERFTKRKYKEEKSAFTHLMIGWALILYWVVVFTELL